MRPLHLTGNALKSRHVRTSPDCQSWRNRPACDPRLPQAEQVLAGKEGTFAEFRAAREYFGYSQLLKGDAIKKRRRELLEWLAYNKASNIYTDSGKFQLGMALIAEGKRDAGMAMLRGLANPAKPFYSRLQNTLKELEDPSSPISQSLIRRNAQPTNTQGDRND